MAYIVMALVVETAPTSYGLYSYGSRRRDGSNELWPLSVSAATGRPRNSREDPDKNVFLKNVFSKNVFLKLQVTSHAGTGVCASRQPVQPRSGSRPLRGAWPQLCSHGLYGHGLYSYGL